MSIERLVSGGQTGVDRAALDLAFELGFDAGGWVPKGRLAEDGALPERYGMTETSSDDPACVFAPRSDPGQNHGNTLKL
jgi:hypothetical protein